eukprot:CAMPEP_0197631216 /NCGR_PEP_ID=MMETSP1338-20131121/8458_1 /TAXON_ID=43686 ORGANISM="Pelagodinium beii, Strain RCC1491" /NCGR_SAMPLE_ID=MMETSP1338 /ASSEMBLY_ACC=CAM_ASM_000754 /LENGTH=35 /DNA_ID= /DNA_START= /DNA_END= /DNA_ORIENTATION=
MTTEDAEPLRPHQRAAGRTTVLSVSTLLELIARSA